MRAADFSGASLVDANPGQLPEDVVPVVGGEAAELEAKAAGVCCDSQLARVRRLFIEIRVAELEGCSRLVWPSGEELHLARRALRGGCREPDREGIGRVRD